MARSARCLPTNGITPASSSSLLASSERDWIRTTILCCHHDLRTGDPARTLTTRVPDLAVFVAEQMVEHDGYIHSAPELVVEVLSPANTAAERAEKLKDYESLGVPEVWVVSPEAETVEVLLQDGRLTTTTLLSEGQIAPRIFRKPSSTSPPSGRPNKKRRVR